MSPRPAAVVCAGVLVVALAGCGAGDSGGSSASPGPGPSPPVPTTTAAAVTTATTAQTTTTSSSTVVPTSVVYPEAINDSMEVEDGHYATVEEMAQAADLVIIGDVVSVESIGRPNQTEDPWADEYVAVDVEPTEVLKGEDAEHIVLGWDAIGVDSDGNRVATLLNNGIRPPEVGDRMLLFLDPAPASFADALAGRPTHSPVILDGVAYLDGDRLVEGETVSTTAAELLGMSLPQIRALVQHAAEHPRDVGGPIQPGGG